ncbi:hypothetical protein [Rubeoparvulum massiliense]|uniref:hypothetical protein n=1 Tax=Rubeoparvulum massiliense TaxID=1631346 RepID=UPI00065DD7A1|nr:hypothetical protein [Rubeoparvulum massiliense]
MGAGAGISVLILAMYAFILYLIVKLAVKHAIRESVDDFYEVIKEGMRDGMKEFSIEERVREAKDQKRQQLDAMDNESQSYSAEAEQVNNRTEE